MQLLLLPDFVDEADPDDGILQFVGLDAIKIGLEGIGGTIDANAREEGGKRIRIRLPLTLSIIPSQIV
jgi:two-component system chemotaxis sensor kinase CheA